MIKSFLTLLYLIVISTDLYANENYITLKEFKNNSDNKIIFMDIRMHPDMVIQKILILMIALNNEI